MQDVEETVLRDSHSFESVAVVDMVRKSPRPSKAKRDRYRKFVRRLEIQILANPDLFDVDKIDLPHSLQTKDKQRQKLMQRLLSFQHRAKIGELEEDDDENEDEEEEEVEDQDQDQDQDQEQEQHQDQDQDQDVAILAKGSHLSFISAPSGLEGHSFDLQSTGSFPSGQSCIYPTSMVCMQDVGTTVLSDSHSFESAAVVDMVRGSHRPCKAKRDRYKNLVRRLEIQILANPDLFDVDKINLPPSLQANDKQRQKLIQRLLRFKNQAKTGEVANCYWIAL